MNITITPLTTEAAMRRACDMTRKPGMVPSKMTLSRIYQCEHSPARLIRYWVELRGIPTFVSVHLVRHKLGVEHFVESNRDDRGGAGDAVVTRETPVNHGMDINAAAVISISRKRLCYASHVRTVAVWRKLRSAMAHVDPALANAMAPECAFRGYCPELRECKPGLARVLRAYKDSQPVVLRDRVVV
ncbi:MAG TPA: hypothetical protein PLE35_11635 [Lentisphaeria bacterium]|nr:hypothetical protein [Lentisphaeria bacterium]